MGDGKNRHKSGHPMQAKKSPEGASQETDNDPSRYPGQIAARARRCGGREQPYGAAEEAESAVGKFMVLRNLRGEPQPLVVGPWGIDVWVLSEKSFIEGARHGFAAP